MNVSYYLTLFLTLLLIPMSGYGQAVRPYPPVEVVQTDTFEYVFVSHSPATVVRFPSNADFFGIQDLGGGMKKLRYSPDNAFEGRDSILVEYYPKLNSSHEYFGFSFLVKPSIVITRPDYAVTPYDTPITLDVLDNDETTNGSLSLSAIVIQRFGSCVIQNNQVVFTPEAGFSGTAQFAYNTCNDDGICKSGIANIFVKPENDVITSDTGYIQTPKNTSKEILILLDGYDNVAVSPINGSLEDVTHDVVRYVPDNNFVGNDVFTLSRQIGNDVVEKTFEITVFNKLSDKVHAVSDYYFTQVNQSISFNVLSNDVGAYQVIYPNQIKVSSGTLVYNGNGNFTYTPKANWSGLATFKYSLGSPAYGVIVEQGDVEIRVDNYNPRLPVYSLQTYAGKPIVIRYDIPVEPWNFEMKVDPLHGDVSIHDGHQTINIESQNVTGYNLVTYTPDSGFEDDFDEFEVRYCVSGVCKTVKFIVHVLPNPNPNDIQCVDVCIWPGDTNRDGVVNVRDLLSVGFALGSNGDERENASSDWTPQFSDAWQDPWTAPGLALEHCDTDGDGLISSLDTISISQSYLNTHKVTTTFAHQLTSDADLRFLVRDPASYGADTLIILDILYGLESKPAYNAYGFTFEIDFADVVDVTGKNVRVTYYNDSWLSRQIPMLSMFKRLDNTIIHSGYTKTDGIGGVGFGPVGFVIVDDIEGARPPAKLRASIPGGRSYLTVRNITTMNAEGQYFYHPDQVIAIDFGGEPEAPVTQETVHVFPNPAYNTVNVSTKELDDITAIQIFNLHGQEVAGIRGILTNAYQMDVTNLMTGMYIMRVHTAGGAHNTKIEVIHN